MKSRQQTIAIGGIDTNAGKSIVTGLLAGYLLRQGHTVTTLKLVQTGCREIADDIKLHRQIMGQPLSEMDRDGTTCPYIFPFPASPSLAAKMSGKEIEAEVLDLAMARLQQAYEWVLVEGAGGLLVPLNDRLLLLDYLADKNLPLILVTSPRLGSINHTRLSLEAIRARQIHLLGLVYNLHGNHPGEIVQDTLGECRKALNAYGLSETIVVVPDMKESTSAPWQNLITAAQRLD